jgi:hypothetical protein
MENEKQEPFDYEKAKQKVKEQFRTGKSLFGKEGAFAPLLQEMINSILEGEMEGHLDEDERSSGNRKMVKKNSRHHLLGTAQHSPRRLAVLSREVRNVKRSWLTWR